MLLQYIVTLVTLVS